MSRKIQILYKCFSCPECGGDRLVSDDDMGELVCQSCGLVIDDTMFDRGPEWRAFTPEERAKMRRTGSPESYSVYDKGLSTEIRDIGRDAYGRAISPETRRQMYRLRRWQIRASMRSSSNKNLAQAMSKLNRFADKMGIPSQILERAAIIYRKALKEGLVRGRSIVAIASASLYAACRLSGIPRTLKEVALVSSVSKGDVARCYRLLLQNLRLVVPVVDPKRWVSKIGSKARISAKTQSLAVKLLRRAYEKNAIVGKNPSGLAAAALYIASVMEGEKKTQREIAEAANVTEVTVRNRYKGLKKALNLT